PTHAVLPALQARPDAEPEVQRLAAVLRRVELLAGRVRDAHVVDLDRGSGGGLGAVTLDHVGDLEVGRGRAVGEVDLGLVHAPAPPGDGPGTALRAALALSPRLSVVGPSVRAMLTTARVKPRTVDEVAGDVEHEVRQVAW